jgi:hypothetical protein
MAARADLTAFLFVLATALAIGLYLQPIVRIDLLGLTDLPTELGFKLEGKPVHLRLGYVASDDAAEDR